MANINPGEVLGRVLYDNRLRALTVVGSDSNAPNLYDWLAFTSVASPYTLDIPNPDPAEVSSWDALAFLIEPVDFDVEAFIDWTFLEEGDPTTIGTEVTIPAGCSSVMVDVSPFGSGPFTNVAVGVNTSGVTIRQIALGPALDFARGQWQGIKPGKLNTEVKRDITVAVNGSIIGTNVTRVTRQDQISLDYLPRDWVADEWLPFAKHAQRFPFFWQYAPVTDPESVTFSHARSVPDPELSAPSPLMKVSLPLVHEP